MEFRISDTFTSSLARLTGEEQKAVKTAAFDLQLNPASPGFNFHKLDKARDKRFWSVRVNRDIRLIVHRTEESLLLCYVDHHDNAYNWAERRKLEVHPKTGAAQIVQIRETIQEIFVPVYVEQTVHFVKETKPLFNHVSDDVLLSFGVPEEWLNDVKQATEDNLFVLVEHLPSEAGEALLELATGGKPVVKLLTHIPADPYEHPDAQRRFRTLKNIEELERALDFPWDKWAVFLHPEQQEIVSKSFTGPAKVSGSAGTGKTIVAVHRAVYLAKHDTEARVLLTTFSTVLASVLKNLLRKLISNEPGLAERIDVAALDDLGERLYRANIGKVTIADREQMMTVLKEVLKDFESFPFSLAFLIAEWEQIVDTWHVQTWEDYRDVKRLGRKTRLPEQQRLILWEVYEKVRRSLQEKGMQTYSDMFHHLANFVTQNNRRPYDFIVVDEAQDITVSQLGFLATLARHHSNGLFLAGDTGQRIFQQPFSWKSLGVDIRGRSKTLTVNYRTSHQIRQKADLLLGPDVADFDGNVELRNHTVSLFNGPQPEIHAFITEQEEVEAVARWVSEQLHKQVAPHEIAIFVRSETELPRAIAAVDDFGGQYKILNKKVETQPGSIAISTMHYAKGLEFKSVVVMACDDEVIPLQERVSAITDAADLEEAYRTERHLLYVACTRARDCLLITGVEPASEFLEDMKV